MKYISFSGILIGVLILVIVSMAVYIVAGIRNGLDDYRRELADNTPTAETPGPANEVEALRLIAPENHMPGGYSRLFNRTEKRKFYQEQLKAMAYLGDHQVRVAIPQLILYLDYPTSEAEAGTKDYAHGPETERARKVWPAFGALLEIPGSGAALESYCLDATHPMRYRLAVFEILPFVDAGLAEAYWQKLKGEGEERFFQDGYDRSRVGRDVFWGVQDSTEAW